jgi:hypothetical protein
MQTSKEKDLNILDLFEAHETAMHDIYSLFASRYGDYEDFWRGIAEEEKVHARWIRSIRSKVETEDLKVVADMVSVATIENSLEYMKAQIMDFSSQENSVDRAFELAMRIENSIVERAIFDIVRTESEDIKKILLNLEEKTSQHYFRIKEMAKTRTRLHGLVDSGILSASDLASVYETAAKEGQSAEWLVMEQYKIPKAALLKSIGAFCNLPQWSFDKQNPCFPTGLSQTLAGKYETLKSELFVPVAQEGRKIIVAVADPMDIVKTDYIKKYFSNHHVEFRVGIPDDISAAVDTFFGIQNEAIGESIPKILDVMKSEAMVDAVDEESAEQEISENDNIVVRLVNNIIIDAANFNASDIHIEPSLDDDVRVRYRIDGMMSYAHVFPRKFQGAVCSRIKIMAGLDIAERRKPQSGKIRFKRWGPSDIELRVETYSTVSGAEDIVMRILSSSKPLPLAQLNFSRYNLDEFTRLISQPYGIILCVGPTGSGKTTTLHSALKYLTRED